MPTTLALFELTTARSLSDTSTAHDLESSNSEILRTALDDTSSKDVGTAMEPNEREMEFVRLLAANVLESIIEKLGVSTAKDLTELVTSRSLSNTNVPATTTRSLSSTSGLGLIRKSMDAGGSAPAATNSNTVADRERSTSGLQRTDGGFCPLG